MSTASAIATRRLSADESGFRAAGDLIRSGGLVAFPTETVYGLGADAGNETAVARLYAAKGRPSFNPLIVHLADSDAAFALAAFGPLARRLAARFWPGPLTLVVPRRPGDGIADIATAGLATVGLRVPASSAAQEFLRAAGRPVVGPSANRSGHVSPTRAEHVLADLSGRIDAVLDAGPTTVGVESTILDCTGAAPRLLRPGGVTREAIEAALGAPLTAAETPDDPEKPLSPGLLASHYAPAAPVRLDVAEVRPGEAFIGFAGARPPGLAGAAVSIDLSPAGDLVEAAARLFAALRRLDRPGITGIAVAPIPAEGLGAAIRDRLARAAAPRS